MSWPFWSFRTVSPASPSFALPPGCDLIEPLLPLYADGMASPDEMRLVEAHLPGCAGCRESLSWMQATHRALAARPIAVPPADLHSRIAEAIAASSAAPPLRPARSFTLRPAYAAAASLTTIGAIGLALSYPLWHSPIPPAGTVEPAPTKAIASLPPVKGHSSARTLHGRSARPLVASGTAAFLKPAVKPVPILRRKSAPVTYIAPQDQVANNTVADNAPAPTHAFAPPHAQTKPVVHLSMMPHDKPLVASSKITFAEERHSESSKILMPKSPAPLLLARHEKEPVPVQVHVEPPTVFVQPPTLRTASSTINLSSLLTKTNTGSRSQVGAPATKNPFTARLAYQSAANIARTIDNEHSGYQAAIYTP